MRIHLEAEAILYIQDLIKDSCLSLVTSYILAYENGNNPYLERKKTISSFMNAHESYYVDEKNKETVSKIAEDIKNAGIKSMDALHVACAIQAECDYFITTDDKLLRYQTDAISIVSPEEFIRIFGEVK